MLKVALGPQYLKRPLRNGSSCIRNYSTLPRVVAPSFWHSLIPKPLRSGHQSTDISARPKSALKPWNPATFFIFIFLIIGSNSINLLAVKQDFLSFSRQADAKIAALREAIGKVQRGEEVDVKRLLGTGNPAAEQEWEEVLKELKQERPPLASKRNTPPKAKNQDDNTGDKTAFASMKKEGSAQVQNDSRTNRKVDFY